jgi:hypothetical protein
MARIASRVSHICTDPATLFSAGFQVDVLL